MEKYEWLKEEIVDYITYKYPAGALLITGEWGTGKTFAVERIAEDLENEMKNKYLFVFISLFGINSIDEIEKRIKEKIYLSSFTENPKCSALLNALSVASVFSDKAKNAKNFVAVDIYDILEIKNEIIVMENKKHTIKKELVLVIDDFERMSKDLNVATVMGVINSYVEKKKIKTLIIADENKIKEPKKDADYRYSDVKEKLISRSFYVGDMCYENAEKIISSYKPKIDKTANEKTVYNIFLAENKDEIMWIWRQSGCTNLRMLKCMLADFERIYNAVPFGKDRNENKRLTDLFPRLLHAFGGWFLENKQGNIHKEGANFIVDSEDGQSKISAKDYVNSKYLTHKCDFSMNAIVKWMCGGDYDEEAIVNEVREIALFDQRILSTNILCLEETELARINELINHVNTSTLLSFSEAENHLTFRRLLSIMTLSERLDYHKIAHADLDYDGILKKIEAYKAGIFNGNNTDCSSRDQLYLEKFKNSKAKKILEEIMSLPEYAEKCAPRNEFIQFLKDPDVSSFNKDPKNGSYTFDTNLCKLVMNTYMECNNEKKYSIFQIVTYTKFEATEETIKNLKDLKDFLGKQKSDGMIVMRINECFIEAIGKKIEDAKKTMESIVTPTEK